MLGKIEGRKEKGTTEDETVGWHHQFNGQELGQTPGDAVDVGSIPGSERCPGEGNGNPLQYSCLENFMDRGTCQATVYETTVGHV